MANYYTEFSFTVDVASEEEARFFVDWVDVDEDDLEEDDERWGVEVHNEGRHIWITGGESGSPDNAARMVAEFQEKFNKQEDVQFCWGNSCSKPRLDAFGGGAVLVYKGQVHWAPNPELWCMDKLEELQKQEKADAQASDS